MLQQIATYAQAFTTLGIFLSLIFVILEVHQSNTESRFSNFLAVTGRIMAFRKRFGEPHYVDIVLRGRTDIKQLSEIEAEIFQQHLLDVEIVAQSAYRLRGRAFANSDTNRLQAIRLLKMEWDHPGPREWWTEIRRDPPFPGFLADLIDEALGYE